MKAKNYCPEFEEYKTIRQWALLGQLPKKDAKGVELWANRNCQTSYVYYKFDGKQAICGTFFITGDNGEDSLSLTENQVKKYLEMFKKPDRFTEREIGEAFRCEVHFISFEELTPIQAPERAAAKPKPKGSPKR